MYGCTVVLMFGLTFNDHVYVVNVVELLQSVRSYRLHVNTIIVSNLILWPKRWEQF